MAADRRLTLSDAIAGGIGGAIGTLAGSSVAFEGGKITSTEKFTASVWGGLIGAATSLVTGQFSSAHQSYTRDLQERRV
jgi:uncharacterized YccA/Bax inhibitor family protein